MPATNEEFIKKAFEAGLSEDQVRAAVAERNQKLGKTQTQEPGLLSKGLNAASRILDIPSSMVGGQLKGVRESVTGEYKAPQTGIKIKGHDIGEALPPFAVEGFRSLKNLATGKEYSPVMTELPKTMGVDPNSLAGMALGLAGEIATPDPLDFIGAGVKAKKLAQKGVVKTGEVVERGGEKLVVRGLRASPSQQKKFAEETGKKLSEFMAENGITSDFVEKSAQKIDELQGAFDEIALRSDLKIPKNDLINRFGSKVGEYTSSIVPELKGKAESIKQVGENLVAKYGDDISVADLTKERRSVDALLKEGSFNLPVEQANYLRTVRDVLQETIQDYTSELKSGGKNLKQIGISLRDMFKFQRIARAQEGLGKGTKLMGLTDWLALAGGGLAGGAPNALTALLANKAISHPKTIGAISRTLGGAGSLLQSGVAQNIAGYGVDAIRRAGRVGLRYAN